MAYSSGGTVPDRVLRPVAGTAGVDVRRPSSPPLNPPLLGQLPKGSTVVMRRVHQLTVEVLYGEDDFYFTAVLPDRDEPSYFARAAVAARDLPLVRARAPFWLAVETVRRPDGRNEWRSAIAFRHDGARTVEEAFANRGDTT